LLKFIQQELGGILAALVHYGRRILNNGQGTGSIPVMLRSLDTHHAGYGEACGRKERALEVFDESAALPKLAVQPSNSRFDRLRLAIPWASNQQEDPGRSSHATG
jgi:hypothetical protein